MATGKIRTQYTKGEISVCFVQKHAIDNHQTQQWQNMATKSDTDDVKKRDTVETAPATKKPLT